MGICSGRATPPARESARAVTGESHDDMTAIGGVRTRVIKSAAAARSARILSQRRSSRVATPRGDRKATVSRRAQVLEEDVKYVEETTADMFSQVDEKKMLEEKAFPIKPEELVRLTKEFLSLNNGCDKPEILADDFTFAGPVVGPIPKDAFVKAFSSFQVGDAFPDMKANAYNFHVDPFDGNRVWFMSRAVNAHRRPRWQDPAHGNQGLQPPPGHQRDLQREGPGDSHDRRIRDGPRRWKHGRPRWCLWSHVG